MSIGFDLRRRVALSYSPAREFWIPMDLQGSVNLPHSPSHYQCSFPATPQDDLKLKKRKKTSLTRVLKVRFIVHQLEEIPGESQKSVIPTHLYFRLLF